MIFEALCTVKDILSSVLKETWMRHTVDEKLKLDLNPTAVFAMGFLCDLQQASTSTLHL